MNVIRNKNKLNGLNSQPIVFDKVANMVGFKLFSSITMHKICGNTFQLNELVCSQSASQSVDRNQNVNEWFGDSVIRKVSVGKGMSCFADVT